jgi:predicted dehydrogenase/threonine dehydrogenase-like Zn-dependent dehydrogenase
MKQVFQNYKSGAISLDEVPVPACKAGGILVRTLYSAISPGTELMKIAESKMSLLDKARARPDQVRKVLAGVAQNGLLATYQKVMDRLDSLTPLGYSLCGEVVEVGAGVTQFNVGDRVACAGNLYALHAHYNWVPINLAVPVPASVDPMLAAFGTIGAVALQGVRQADVRPGEIVCVIGLGLIGQLLVRILKASGARPVGVELSSERCELARAAGCELVFNPSTDTEVSFIQNLDNLTDSRGCDHIIIASGGASNAAIDLAPVIGRDRSRVTVVGKTGLSLSWNAFYEKEMDVVFSRSYGPGRYDPNYEERGIDYPIGHVRWTEQRNLAEIVRMIGSGSLDMTGLVGEPLPFERAVEAFEKLHKGDLKGVGFVFAYPQDVPVDRRQSRVPAPLLIGARSEVVRIGAIGCGNYASSMLFPHLVKRPDVRLVEVATTTAGSAANAAKRFGFGRVATDIHPLLEADDVDLVMITTRHSSHARLVCAALESGKAVFVEKPLALTLEEVEQIEETIARTGNRRLLVGFNRRYAPMLVRLKEAFSSASSTPSYRVNAGKLGGTSWYLDREGEGSRFIGEGGHFIDTLSWWLGADPIGVSAQRDPSDKESIVITLHYPRSVATIAYLTGGDMRYSKERLEVFGGGQTVILDNFREGELWSGGKRALNLKTFATDKGQRAEMAALVNAVLSGADMPISIDSQLRTTRATILAERAAAEPGRALPIAQ